MGAVIGSRSRSGGTVISSGSGIGRRFLLGLAVCVPASAIGVVSGAFAQKGQKQGEAPPGPIFVNLPIFQIPVIEHDRVTRRVSVGIALELVEGVTEDTVTPKKPLLIDAYLSDLYAVFAQRADASRVADDRLVKARLQQIADRILGPGVVRQVLIQQLFEQPLEN